MSKPSATPITDAHACSANEHDTREFIPVDVAREKLEKPLNEARTDLDAIKALFNHGADDENWIPGKTLAQSINLILRERNSLRRKLSRAESELGNLKGYLRSLPIQ